ncbi:MAG TPA: hypothetical protein DCE33_10000, partial [Rhodospirillaceae bacterium]|nr:hypothetical protein [Rhodospirillaceae bacterium]
MSRIRRLALICSAVVLAVPLAAVANEYATGKKALDNQDYLKAVKAFRAGIAKGDKKSPNALGEMYVLGLGVDKDKTL